MAQYLNNRRDYGNTKGDSPEQDHQDGEPSTTGDEPTTATLTSGSQDGDSSDIQISDVESD